jgi:hypothetical protein
MDEVSAAIDRLAALLPEEAARAPFKQKVLQDFKQAAAITTPDEVAAEGRPARPDDAAMVRASAGLEHLQKQFASASGLPEAERARIGRQLVAAFERLQKRVEMKTPPEVRAARGFLTGYNRRQKAAKATAKLATASPG